MKITNEKIDATHKFINDVDSTIGDLEYTPTVPSIPKGALVSAAHRKKYSALKKRMDKQVKALRADAQQLFKLLDAIEEH